MTELVLSPSNGEMALLWNNLSVLKPSLDCRVKNNGQGTCDVITDNVSGFINFGEMAAILGPSGAGKTSLLRSLYGTSNLKYFGEIFVNCSNKEAVFITQSEDDHLLQSLTVEESLYFSSHLKSKNHSHPNRINDLLFQLGLESCRCTAIKHCSGGEKKRLTIAQELAGDQIPGIIFMDEPTSGLDSKASHILMLYLQNVCQKYQISLLITIHQPSFTLLRLFNKIYVMSLSGHFLFYGIADDIPFCLSEVDIKIPEGCNPGDVLLDIASLTEMSESDPFEDEFEATVDDDSEASITLQNANKLERFTETRIKEDIENRGFKNLSKVGHLFQNEDFVSWAHIKLLLHRMFLSDIIHAPSLLLIKILVHIMAALFVVYFYTNAAAEDDGCVPDVEHSALLNCQYQKISYWKKFGLITNSNFIFYNYFLLALTAMISSIIAFTSEMKIFVNEHRNCWYSTASYYIARNVFEIILQIPLPCIYFLLISFSAKQLTLNSFWETIPFTERSHFKDLSMIAILVTIVVQGIGFTISSMFSRSTAFFVGFSYFMFNFVLSNFLINFKQGSLTSYVSYSSFARWMMESAVSAIYGGRCNTLNVDQVRHMKEGVISAMNRSELPKILQSMLVNEISKNSTEYKSKAMIYEAFNMSEHSIYYYYAILFAMLVVWRIVAFILLKLKVRPKSFLI